MFAYRIGFRFFAGINQHKTGTFILPSPFRKQPLGSPRSAAARSPARFCLFRSLSFAGGCFASPDEKRVRYAVSARTNPPPHCRVSAARQDGLRSFHCFIPLLSVVPCKPPQKSRSRLGTALCMKKTPKGRFFKGSLRRRSYRSQEIRRQGWRSGRLCGNNSARRPGRPERCSGMLPRLSCRRAAGRTQ